MSLASEMHARHSQEATQMALGMLSYADVEQVLTDLEPTTVRLPEDEVGVLPWQFGV